MSGRKGLVRLAGLVLAAVLLCAAVAPALAQDKDAEKAKYIWKMATLAPKGVGWAIHVNNLLLPWVKKMSNGEVYIKIYWGGVMGDEDAAIKKMSIGQLQGGGFSGQGATMLCPEFAVFELPFLFNDYGEVDYIKDTMTESMDKQMEKYGVKFLMWGDQDFDQIYSTRWPLNKLDEFRKAKFFTWYGELEAEVFKKLGVVPITIDVPEAPTAVRQGIADSAIAPSIFMVGTQMYNIVKYVNPVKIRYSPGPIVVTLAAYNELPPAYKETFSKDRYNLVKEFCKLARIDNQKCLDAMIKYGVKKVEMSPDELAKMKSLTRPVWDEMAGKLYPKSLLEEVQSRLAEYRSKHPTK
ncbi:MAG: TRAP transporter substrate-binding protein DctP [Thermodesulfobacteriota bacterium]